MAAFDMNSDACVLVSGFPDHVDSQFLATSVVTEEIGYGQIRQLIMFPKMGTALIEFLAPEYAATVLANQQQSLKGTPLQVRGLPSAFSPQQDVHKLETQNSQLKRQIYVQSHLHADLQTGLKAAQQSLISKEHELQCMTTENQGLQSELKLERETNRCLSDRCWELEDHIADDKGEIERLKTEVIEEREVTSRLFSEMGQRLDEEMFHLENQAQADKTEIERLKTEITREREDKKRSLDLCQGLEEENVQLKDQVEANKVDIEQMTAGLLREIQDKRRAFDLCREVEEQLACLKMQAEADKREMERLKQQIASSYEMSHVPRGVAVIVNNIHFEDMTNRDGAEADTDRLKEAFESLGFTVVTFHDLDHAKMVDVMKEQGKADHSNYDCFVCCVMSHGTMGKVFSSNDVGIDIYDLMKLFNSKRCPSLKGKPKLFFIQACQGEKQQGRESFDGDHDAKPVPFICHEADFFLGLSTVPGYVARRDHDGAPYVHHLAKMLKEFGQTHDLCTIMAMVCDKMNEINDDKFGWISSNHSTLRKTIVFKNK